VRADRRAGARGGAAAGAIDGPLEHERDVLRAGALLAAGHVAARGQRLGRERARRVLGDRAGAGALPGGGEDLAALEGGAHCLPERGHVGLAPDGAGQVRQLARAELAHGGVVRRDGDRGAACQLAGEAVVDGDHRPPAGHRLERAAAPGVGASGRDEAVDAAVELGPRLGVRRLRLDDQVGERARIAVQLVEQPQHGLGHDGRRVAER
jgi:hypothetical protein